MNGKQKLVRGIGLSILVLVALFPPWKLSYKPEQKAETRSSFIGYHPLWSPPAHEVEVAEKATDLEYRVDVVRLGLQLAGVLVLLNVALYLTKGRH